MNVYSMYVCRCVYVCMCVCMYVYSMCVCRCVYVCMCVCMYVYSMCVCMYVYVCMCVCIQNVCVCVCMHDMDIFMQFPRGAYRDFGPFLTNLDLLKKNWTFQYAAGFRGPGILIKRSTFVDLSVHRMAQRSRYLTKHPQKGLKNIQKPIAELSHLAVAATRRIIIPHATYQILDHFGLSKFKGGGGNAPPGRLIKISLHDVVG